MSAYACFTQLGVIAVEGLRSVIRVASKATLFFKCMHIRRGRPILCRRIRRLMCEKAILESFQPTLGFQVCHLDIAMGRTLTTSRGPLDGDSLPISRWHGLTRRDWHSMSAQ